MKAAKRQERADGRDRSHDANADAPRQGTWPNREKHDERECGREKNERVSQRRHPYEVAGGPCELDENVAPEKNHRRME